jgi:hypothetical protein
MVSSRLVNFKDQRSTGMYPIIEDEPIDEPCFHHSSINQGRDQDKVKMTHHVKRKQTPEGLHRYNREFFHECSIRAQNH